jgi:hypothetical protein
VPPSTSLQNVVDRGVQNLLRAVQILLDLNDLHRREVEKPRRIRE